MVLESAESIVVMHTTQSRTAAAEYRAAAADRSLRASEQKHACTMRHQCSSCYRAVSSVRTCQPPGCASMALAGVAWQAGLHFLPDLGVQGAVVLPGRRARGATWGCEKLKKAEKQCVKAALLATVAAAAGARAGAHPCMQRTSQDMG
jgi:hypothetical protein